MPEYHALRLILAAALLALAKLTRSRLIRAWAIVEAVSLLWPLNLGSPAWWRYEWSPLAIVRLLMAVAMSLDAFSFARYLTSHTERRLVVAWATTIGLLMALLCWSWIPENRFQSFAVLRQYLILVLAAGYTAAWLWVTYLRPLVIGTDARAWGSWWNCWLWCSFVAATTTKHGLAWQFVPWHDGLWWWRLLSDVALVGQCGVAAAWLSLRQPHVVPRERTAASRYHSAGR